MVWVLSLGLLVLRERVMKSPMERSVWQVSCQQPCGFENRTSMFSYIFRNYSPGHEGDCNLFFKGVIFFYVVAVSSNHQLWSKYGMEWVTARLVLPPIFEPG